MVDLDIVYPSAAQPASREPMAVDPMGGCCGPLGARMKRPCQWCFFSPSPGFFCFPHTENRAVDRRVSRQASYCSPVYLGKLLLTSDEDGTTAFMCSSCITDVAHESGLAGYCSSACHFSTDYLDFNGSVVSMRRKSANKGSVFLLRSRSLGESITRPAGN